MILHVELFHIFNALSKLDGEYDIALRIFTEHHLYLNEKNNSFYSFYSSICSESVYSSICSESYRILGWSILLEPVSVGIPILSHGLKEEPRAGSTIKENYKLGNI